MGGVISAPGAIRFQMPRFWRHKQNCGNSWFWRRRRKFLGVLARFPMIFSHFLTCFPSKSANFVLFVIQGSISGARTTLEYTMGFLRPQDLFLGPDTRPSQFLLFQDSFLLQILRWSSHCVFHTVPDCVSASFSTVPKIILEPAILDLQNVFQAPEHRIGWVRGSTIRAM